MSITWSDRQELECVCLWLWILSINIESACSLPESVGFLDNRSLEQGSELDSVLMKQPVDIQKLREQFNLWSDDYRNQSDNYKTIMAGGLVSKSGLLLVCAMMVVIVSELSLVVVGKEGRYSINRCGTSWITTNWAWTRLIRYWREFTRTPGFFGLERIGYLTARM